MSSIAGQMPLTVMDHEDPELFAELTEAVRRVASTGAFTGGAAVADFEADYAGAAAQPGRADREPRDGDAPVGRVGRNRRDVAERLHETLTGAGAPLLGVVANGFKSSRLGGAYGYTYDYPAAGAAATTSATVVSRNGATPEEPVPASSR